MENEWDAYAAGWDTDAGARAYAAAAFDSLADLLERHGSSLDGAAVLDFGCGTGLLTECLVDAGAAVRAVDTSPAMLAVLADKIGERAWTTVETSTELPDSTRRFDLVVCSSVCAFLDDHPSTVRELTARLEPGGLFVQWDWERRDGDEPGLTRPEILQALGGAGLTDVDVHIGFTIQVDDQVMAPLMGHGRRPADGGSAG